MRLPRYEATLRIKGRRTRFPVRTAFAGVPGGRWIGTATFEGGLPEGRIVQRTGELQVGEQRLPILITRRAHRPDTVDFELVRNGRAR
jgi:hypothetical protein